MRACAVKMGQHPCQTIRWSWGEAKAKLSRSQAEAKPTLEKSGGDMLNNDKPIVYGIVNDSIVDGPGMRLAIFLQGCPHHCDGCHNPDSQVIPETMKNMVSVGTVMEPSEILDKMTPLTKGITISGGDPFLQPVAVLSILEEASARGITDVWIWSGWTYEHLMDPALHPLGSEILSRCSVLVDGPFVLEGRNTLLAWRGSPNQRVIDLRESTPGNVVTIPTEDT